MKKKIMITVALILAVAAAGLGGYFIGQKDKDPRGKSPYIVLGDFVAHQEQMDAIVKLNDISFLTEHFGMTEQEAKALLNAPDEWRAFDLTINIFNGSNADRYFFKATCPDNGTNGVYVECVQTSTLGIPAGGEGAVCVSVLVHNSKLTDAQCQALTEEMAISVTCSESEDMTAKGARLSEAPLKEDK